MTDRLAPVRSFDSTAPRGGRLLYRLLPIRRRTVLANLRRVFGGRLSEPEIVGLAQAHYAHLARCAAELAGSVLRPELRPPARIESDPAASSLFDAGGGVLILTGHFGNWEVALTAAVASRPEYRGRFHILRRPLFPAALDRFVNHRFECAGLGVLPKLGSLERLLSRLEAGDAVVFVLDQHAGGRDGVTADFFGHPASTFRSLAVVSLATGVPVVPASSWREPDGSHVVRFEAPLPILEHDDPAEAIRLNTQAYNHALESLVLRHPEQWFWMHRRWK